MDNQNETEHGATPGSPLAGVTGSAAFIYEAYRSALEEADKRMKESNGHQYLTILKTRCMNCGRSPRVKTRCGGWFQTFVNILGDVLQEKGVITQPPNATEMSHREQ